MASGLAKVDAGFDAKIARPRPIMKPECRKHPNWNHLELWCYSRRYRFGEAAVLCSLYYNT